MNHTTDLIYHPELTKLWREGKKIEAIRGLRDKTDEPLVVCKRLLESYGYGFKDALKYNGAKR